jgi:peptide/nickel transport system ATP-binding protein
MSASNPSAAATDTAVLSVEDLCVTFVQGTTRACAVRHASFDVRPGHIVGLVGESGSGKTATALALLGLHDRRHAEVSGTARFDGVDLLGLDEDDLRRVRGRQIGMVFQEPMTALNPLVRIGVQVREVLLAHTDMSKAEATRRTIEVLGEVGIPNPADRFRAYPHQLSGGLRQRAMIAAAIACEPRLLLADEPTTALDVTIQAQILRLLRRLATSHGMSVVLVTHDLGVVAETCDDVVVMYAGEIVEQGPAAAVLGDPEHPYTDRLLQARPRLDGWGQQLTSIPGRVPPPERARSGCAFMPRCHRAAAACASPQQLLVTADGRRARCWRAGEAMP